MTTDHLKRTSIPLNIPAWRYYAKFYQGSHGVLLLTILISVAQSLFVLPIAFLVRYVFDKVLPAGNVYLLLFIGLAILLLNLTNDGIILLTRYITLRITKLAIRGFREELLKKAYAFSRAYYTEADMSKLHASIVQDTERLDVMSNALVSYFLPALVTSVTLCCVLIYLNWFLSLISIITFPLLYFVSRPIGKMVRKRIYTFHRSFENFSKGILFVLQMMDLTKTQSAETVEIERQRKLLEDLRLKSGTMSWLITAYGLIQNTIATISGIIILVIGGTSVASGSMTLGDLLSFYVAFGLFGNYLKTISSSIPNIIAGNESLITLFNVSNIKDSKPYSGRRQISFGGKIALKSVYFQYAENPILEDINLNIYPNTTIGIAGPNGSGKSTIINLILGFYRPQKGELYADDEPYNELDILALRRNIAVVMQDPIIFPGTIFENITYGCPNATLEQVIQAAELATAHEFIQELPEGYETYVGENGMLLSGGQRQRIAIARALLRQPKLLILDEPTNHLDESSVIRFMNNLKSMDKLPTTLIISHDMDIMRDLNNIYILEEGRILTTGNFETLSLKETMSG
jgi:ABC-type bacteriocin/lantibiotic exporter with double-glycine peptidase domain